MRQRIVLLLLLIAVICPNSIFANILWEQVPASSATPQNVHASRYKVYVTDEAALKNQLFSLPESFSDARVISIPMADGSTRDFKVWNTPMMANELAARYPEIKTFTAIAIDDPNVTAKLDYTVYGFHAMVFDRDKITIVNPADDVHSGYYIAHYKQDETAQLINEGKCQTIEKSIGIRDKSTDIGHSGYKVVNGTIFRTYDIAIACSHQYAVAATGLSAPSVAQVLSKMLTTMSRVNGVYERELSITMQFVAKEDALIFNVETGGINGTDVFSSIDSKPYDCMVANQTLCDQRIGNLNYDLGHVFTTNAGGQSQIGCVCNSLTKAQSVTGQPHPTGDGFDIDYVAHEVGHEFGADHTFNNSNDGSCSGFNNISEATAYEPGSGSTIMAYAGICSPDNIQPHSDDYFHAISLAQIHDFIIMPGNGCASITSTANKTVYEPSFATTYKIPFQTPFELTAPKATDSVSSSSITYCWEQWNLGDVGQRFVNTHNAGPLFRSYAPSSSPVRVFPKVSMVLSGTLSDAGKDNAQGERAPDVARFLTFKLTVRNIYNSKGCVLVPDDTVHLDVINTGKGFKVTSQDDSTAVYFGGSLQEITWDVVGTDKSPINASNVDIYMSEDGGYTWPHHIGTVPNTGHASIPLANPDTNTKLARIKVKGADNVFFNVNKCNFSVTHNDGTDTAISVSPVPTHTTLRVSSGNKGQQEIRIFNAAGASVYSGIVNGLLDIPVYTWARGMYIIRLIDTHNNRTVKKIVVE